MTFDEALKIACFDLGTVAEMLFNLGVDPERQKFERLRHTANLLDDARKRLVDIETEAKSIGNEKILRLIQELPESSDVYDYMHLSCYGQQHGANET
jgi:hypothetical protein